MWKSSSNSVIILSHCALKLQRVLRFSHWIDSSKYSHATYKFNLTKVTLYCHNFEESVLSNSLTKSYPHEKMYVVTEALKSMELFLYFLRKNTEQFIFHYLVAIIDMIWYMIWCDMIWFDVMSNSREIAVWTLESEMFMWNSYIFFHVQPSALKPRHCSKFFSIQYICLSFGIKVILVIDHMWRWKADMWSGNCQNIGTLVKVIYCIMKTRIGMKLQELWCAYRVKMIQEIQLGW